MAMEIERRFIVGSVGGELAHRRMWHDNIKQGYLVTEGKITTRVRLVNSTDAWLTIKGPSVKGFGKPEFEYPVPFKDGKAMMELCGDHIVKKVRHKINPEGIKCENIVLDVFTKDHKGLILVEIEFKSEKQAAKFYPPDWFGREVVDKRLSNKNLSMTRGEEFDKLLRDFTKGL